MFEPGDNVVHARHGSGTVIESRTLTYEGRERVYFCIKLNDQRQTLMIPEDTLDADEIRPAMNDTALIEAVMLQEPAELSDNYRARQAIIRDQLRTRNPRKLASALRDLSWLEVTHKLTNTDSRLRDRLVKALARELSLTPGVSLTEARFEIDQITKRAMDHHLETYGDGPTST